MFIYTHMSEVKKCIWLCVVGEGRACACRQGRATAGLNYLVRLNGAG